MCLESVLLLYWSIFLKFQAFPLHFSIMDPTMKCPIHTQNAREQKCFFNSLFIYKIFWTLISWLFNTRTKIFHFYFLLSLTIRCWLKRCRCPCHKSAKLKKRSSFSALYHVYAYTKRCRGIVFSKLESHNIGLCINAANVSDVVCFFFVLVIIGVVGNKGM